MSGESSSWTTAGPSNDLTAPRLVTLGQAFDSMLCGGPTWVAASPTRPFRRGRAARSRYLARTLPWPENANCATGPPLALEQLWEFHAPICHLGTINAEAIARRWRVVLDLVPVETAFVYPHLTLYFQVDTCVFLLGGLPIDQHRVDDRAVRNSVLACAVWTWAPPREARSPGPPVSLSTLRFAPSWSGQFP